jgi:hypothetical protein
VIWLDPASGIAYLPLTPSRDRKETGRRLRGNPRKGAAEEGLRAHYGDHRSHGPPPGLPGWRVPDRWQHRNGSPWGTLRKRCSTGGHGAPRGLRLRPTFSRGSTFSGSSRPGRLACPPPSGQIFRTGGVLRSVRESGMRTPVAWRLTHLTHRARENNPRDAKTNQHSGLTSVSSVAYCSIVTKATWWRQRPATVGGGFRPRSFGRVAPAERFGAVAGPASAPSSGSRPRAGTTRKGRSERNNPERVAASAEAPSGFSASGTVSNRRRRREEGWEGRFASCLT